MTTESTTETMNDTERRILAILAEATTDGFMPWAVIRDKLPPGFWRRINALDALHQSGAVEVFRSRGRTYVAAADAFTRAAYRAPGPRRALVLS
jgi:hypothetical protein